MHMILEAYCSFTYQYIQDLLTKDGCLRLDVGGCISCIVFVPFSQLFQHRWMNFHNHSFNHAGNGGAMPIMLLSNTAGLNLFIQCIVGKVLSSASFEACFNVKKSNVIETLFDVSSTTALIGPPKVLQCKNVKKIVSDCTSSSGKLLCCWLRQVEVSRSKKWRICRYH